MSTNVKYLLAVSLSVGLFAAGAAATAEESQCDRSCGVNEKLVSYTDGNKVSCSCAKVSEMVPTEPDMELPDTGEYEDEGVK